MASSLILSTWRDPALPTNVLHDIIVSTKNARRETEKAYELAKAVAKKAGVLQLIIISWCYAK